MNLWFDLPYLHSFQVGESAFYWVNHVSLSGTLFLISHQQMFLLDLVIINVVLKVSSNYLSQELNPMKVFISLIHIIYRLWDSEIEDYILFIIINIVSVVNWLIFFLFSTSYTQFIHSKNNLSNKHNWLIRIHLHTSQ